jgi:hypothetical protein
LSVSPRQVWSPPVVGCKWVGSHGPAGRSLYLTWSIRPLEDGPAVPGSLMDIVHAYGSAAWKDWGAWPRGEPVGLCRPEEHGLVEIVPAWGVGVWVRSSGYVKHGPGGSEIPWPAQQWLHGPMGWGLECSAGCGFSKSWHGMGELSELGVQSAKVLALPCALPQPSVSPLSQQSPWFMELMWSAAVSQSPFWISFTGLF